MPRHKNLTKNKLKLKQQILRCYSQLYQPVHLIKLALKVYELPVSIKLTLFINKIMIDFKQLSKKHNEFLKIRQAHQNQVESINQKKNRILNERKQLLEEFITIVQAQNIKIDNQKFLLQKISTKINDKTYEIQKYTEFKKSKISNQNSIVKSIFLKPEKSSLIAQKLKTQGCQPINQEHENQNMAKSLLIYPTSEKKQPMPSIQFLLKDPFQSKKLIKKSSIMCSKPIVTFREDVKTIFESPSKPIKSIKNHTSRLQSKHSIKNSSKGGSKVHFGLLDSCFDDKQNYNFDQPNRMPSQKKLSSKKILVEQQQNTNQKSINYSNKMSNTSIHEKKNQPNLQLLRNSKLIKSRRKNLTISKVKSTQNIDESIKRVYQKKNTGWKNRPFDPKDFKYKLNQSRKSSRSSSRNSKNSGKKLQRMILKKKSYRQPYEQIQIQPLPIHRPQTAAALRFRYSKVQSQSKDQSMKKRQGFYKKMYKVIQQIDFLKIQKKLNTKNGKVNHEDLKTIRDNYVQFRNNIPQLYYYITENQDEQAEKFDYNRFPNSFLMRFHSQDYSKQQNNRMKRLRKFQKQNKMIKFAQKIGQQCVKIDQRSLNQAVCQTLL